jgi:hypothetical protein
MEHIVRGAAPGLILLSLFPAALTACTFDPAGLHDGDGQRPGLADGGPDAAESDDAMSVAADAAATDAVEIADAAPPPADARVCPASFTVLPATGHAYRVRHGHQTWFQAEDTCESTGEGIHLAVLDDAAELAAVLPLVDVPIIWLGVNDVDLEGHFVEVTGGPATFLPWGPGEPNNGMGSEDCVELIADKFNDDSCDTPLPFLCECE